MLAILARDPDGRPGSQDADRHKLNIATFERVIQVGDGLDRERRVVARGGANQLVRFGATNTGGS
ncbi:MAG: hypothetical protein ACYDH6_19570 [Acidimicrobiales bacterium]